jgi:hypothetical protein
MSRTALFTLVSSLAVLVLAGAGVYMMWSDLGVTMSMHGWIAYGLGALASIALSVGLFWLLFHSARSGQDDIDRPEEHRD